MLDSQNVDVFGGYLKEIISKKPGQWNVFINKIITNPRFTHITDTTIIISVYEMSIHQVIILYQMLKQLKRIKIASRVINKKEFVIIHIVDDTIIQYFKNPQKWVTYLLYRELTSSYPNLICEYFPHFLDNDLVISNDYMMFTVSYENSSKRASSCEIDILKVDKDEKRPLGILKFAYNQGLFQKNIKTFFNSVLITC